MGKPSGAVAEMQLAGVRGLGPSDSDGANGVGAFSLHVSVYVNVYSYRIAQNPKSAAPWIITNPTRPRVHHVGVEGLPSTLSCLQPHAHFPRVLSSKVGEPVSLVLN